MASYGYNITNPTFNDTQGGGSAGSQGNSTQQSASQQTSNENASSSSGSAWSADQLARINSLYPFLMGQYSSASQTTPWNDLLSQVGGPKQAFNALNPFPEITQGPIWGAQDIQGRVNASRAQNEMGAAGQSRQVAEKAAASGYGVNSPLVQALQTNIQGQTLATNTGAENDLRWNAAQGNAKHLLDTQTAGVGRATALNAADLARSQAQSEDDLKRRQLAVSSQGQQLQYAASRQNSLLQALGYYNQPLPFAQSSSKKSATSGSFSKGSSDQSSWNNSFNWGKGGGGGGSSESFGWDTPEY